ncbi:MAG: hypothetical protein U9R75_09975, partial [Candidatus Thermoplasmatota archaeon]|nr:hypothetical protein [Candidatus Thermoplasmatota archaeon]
SPIKGEYTISIGPLDSINMYDREMVKYQLSRWARGNIRPRIGYYRILDASYLWRKNRTDINDHLERCRAIAGLKGKK